MKYRVYKIGDRVLINKPSIKFQSNLEKCPHSDEIQSLDPSEWTVEIKDKDEIDVLTNGIHEGGSYQFYYSNNELKFDKDWDECLMSKDVIHKREVDKILLENKEEIEKQSPDVVKIYRNNQSIEELKKLKHDNNEKAFYEKALANLEKENKKPKIQAKLRKKLGLDS